MRNMYKRFLAFLMVLSMLCSISVPGAWADDARNIKLGFAYQGEKTVNDKTYYLVDVTLTSDSDFDMSATGIYVGFDINKVNVARIVKADDSVIAPCVEQDDFGDEQRFEITLNQYSLTEANADGYVGIIYADSNYKNHTVTNGGVIATLYFTAVTEPLTDAVFRFNGNGKEDTVVYLVDKNQFYHTVDSKATLTVPTPAPKLTHVEAKAATCTEAGYEEYWTDADGKLYGDAEGAKEITEPTAIAALGHDWNEWVVTKAPTAEAEGERTRTCKRDASHMETERIPQITLTHVGAVAATCTEAGNKEYWKDEASGKFYGDANGATEITQESTVIAATGHDWNEWVVTREATAEAEGEKTRTCKNDASHTEKEKIPIKGDNDEFSVNVGDGDIQNPSETGKYKNGSHVTIRATIDSFSYWAGLENVEFISGDSSTSTVTFVMPGYDVNPTAHSAGCYVATAVYGSYDCPEVWTLRRFRDKVLAKTWYGRLFIHLYYAVSPTAVKLSTCAVKRTLFDRL